MTQAAFEWPLPVVRRPTLLPMPQRGWRWSCPRCNAGRIVGVGRGYADSVRDQALTAAVLRIVTGGAS